jgi:predicted negative regulator of RcsB-dependent stress response
MINEEKIMSKIKQIRDWVCSNWKPLIFGGIIGFVIRDLLL